MIRSDKRQRLGIMLSTIRLVRLWSEAPAARSAFQPELNRFLALSNLMPQGT